MCPSDQLSISEFRSECLLGPAPFTTKLPAPLNTTSTVLWSGKKVNFAYYGHAPVTIAQDGSPCFVFHLQPLRVSSGTSESVAFLALSFRVDGNGTKGEIITDESRFTLRFDDLAKVDMAPAPAPRPLDVGGRIPQSDRARTPAAPDSPGTTLPTMPSGDLFASNYTPPSAPISTITPGASSPRSAPVATLPVPSVTPSASIPRLTPPPAAAPIPNVLPPNAVPLPPLATPSAPSGSRSSGGPVSPNFSPQVAGSFYVPLNKGNNVILSTRVFKKLKGPETDSITGQFTASEIRGERAATTSRFFLTGQTDIILVGIFVDPKPTEVIAEKDPLDVLNILSSWGGFWQLVAFVLAFLYVSTEPSKTVLDIVALRFLTRLLTRKTDRHSLQASATELTKHASQDLYA